MSRVIFIGFQDFNCLSRYVSDQIGIHFLNYMSDFHLLYYLYTSTPAGIDFKVSEPPTNTNVR